MLGFFTLIALAKAWISGGWWWGLAIFMVLAWAGKVAESQETKSTNDEPIEGDLPKTKEIDSVDMDEVERNILEICTRYSGAGYYVAEMIPTEKLDAAKNLGLSGSRNDFQA